MRLDHYQSFLFVMEVIVIGILQILASLLLCLGLLNSFPIHGKISPLVLMTSSLLIYPYKLLLADQISCSILLLLCYHESELESCLLPSRVYLHI